MSNLTTLKTLGMTARTTLAVIALACCSQVHSAIFVEIPGIPGDSVDKEHADAIVAVSATGDFNGRGCGIFRVVKELDIATPLLIGSVVSRQRHATVDFFLPPALQMPVAQSLSE